MKDLSPSSEKTTTHPPGLIRKRKVYVSAVDLWLAILLMAGPIAFIVLTVLMLQRGENQQALITLLAGAGTLLVTGMFSVPCRYTITDDSLNIRCGILFNRVPLDKIKAVEKSSSWLSGPALSLRRVRVSTASRFFLVSPRHREQFIEELEQAINAARS
jgi:membrane protein YdbS with pleckstrin-like domain